MGTLPHNLPLWDVHRRALPGDLAIARKPMLCPGCLGGGIPTEHPQKPTWPWPWPWLWPWGAVPPTLDGSVLRTWSCGLEASGAGLRGLKLNFSGTRGRYGFPNRTQGAQTTPGLPREQGSWVSGIAESIGKSVPLTSTSQVEAALLHVPLHCPSPPACLTPSNPFACRVGK